MKLPFLMFELSINPIPPVEKCKGNLHRVTKIMMGKKCDY